jgi:hypothetical protein
VPNVSSIQTTQQQQLAALQQAAQMAQNPQMRAGFASVPGLLGFGGSS